MKAKHFMLALALGISFTGFSQTKEKIDKAIKDPQRIENEAKADVLLQDKKIMNKEARSERTEATTNKKKQKKGCKKTCEKKS
jgi:hypothetical protein